MYSDTLSERANRIDRQIVRSGRPPATYAFVTATAFKRLSARRVKT